MSLQTFPFFFLIICKIEAQTPPADLFLEANPSR